MELTCAPALPRPPLIPVPKTLHVFAIPSELVTQHKFCVVVLNTALI